jgi:hypothetical protein
MMTVSIVIDPEFLSACLFNTKPALQRPVTDRDAAVTLHRQQSFELSLKLHVGAAFSREIVSSAPFFYRGASRSYSRFWSVFARNPGEL